MELFKELQRRNVFRVTLGYLVSGWLVVQVADLVLENIGAPAWVMQTILLLLALGFPVVVFFSWAYEVTPEGIKRETEVDRSDSITHVTGRKLDRAIIAVLVIAVAYFAWDKVSTPDLPRPAEAPEAEQAGAEALDPATEHPARNDHSIVVLPLVNMSAVAENAFFVGGVQEEILTNLSRIEGWRVVSRTTAMRYVNSDLSVPEIGRELGVRYIVEGSVRRIDNHVRVTVQLIEATTDEHLWANNYDRELVDVFAVQSAVAREITNSIQLEIQPDSVGQLENMPTRSVKAYDYYIRARSIDRSEIESESSLQRRRELLEKAVEEDPDFVEAWGFLNEILDDMIRHVNQNGWFISDSVDAESLLAELSSQSRRALDRAVALDPENLETLLALASDSVAEARREFVEYRKTVIDRAIELYPDSAMAWYVLGWWNNLTLDLEAAKPAFLKALELDPLHARIVWGSLVHFRLAGDQEMVDLLFDRLAQIAPDMTENDSLAVATESLKIYGLLTSFMETADPSVIETLAGELDKNREDYGGDHQLRWFKAAFWELSNNMEELLTVSPELPLPENPDYVIMSSYVSSNTSLMQAQRLAGSGESAEVLAQRIISAKDYATFNGSENADENHASLVMAYAAVGEMDDARELADWMLQSRSEEYDFYGFSGLVALAELDADKAVRLILEENAKYDNWVGMDLLATYHVTFRNIIVHPDLQSYYLGEGKWVEYLSERVPEYRGYRQRD
jgi:TolB-like protein